jgi:hypothetical protein
MTVIGPVGPGHLRWRAAEQGSKKAHGNSAVKSGYRAETTGYPEGQRQRKSDDTCR